MAVVRTGRLHHPRIFLVDSTKKSSHLLVDKTASEPRWSPDGEMVACVAWESQAEPWVLTIVERRTGRVRQPLRSFNVMGFKWSPDGHWIAAAGAMQKRPRGILALVSVAANSSHVVDTLRVLADYEISWSPDSRAIALGRPTAIDADEEVIASDLWLLDTAGRRCPLIVDPEFVESAPRWLDAHRLRYTRFRKADPQRNPNDVVVELEGSSKR